MILQKISNNVIFWFRDFEEHFVSGKVTSIKSNSFYYANKNRPLKKDTIRSYSRYYL